MEWTFGADVFAWENDGPSWRFLRLPVEVADEVREIAAGGGPGFGSVRVHVRIGDTVWATSVFPEKSSGSYVLPVKKSVRDEEPIDDGDRVTVRLGLADAP
ncbi:DUF1905 domain-containing protein [Pseudonocardia zijingensis]|uniref:DUF1905 domain-containing protein n=1 Tax=Pseudonocardia zijingensis TaxID=153376 RepID=A0ABN1PDV0_9PSEU